MRSAFDQDCACLTHDGPHYLYMDAFWKEKNDAIVAQAIRYEEAAMRVQAAAPMSTMQSRIDYRRWLALRDNQLHCYFQEELRRLAEKELATRGKRS